MNQNYTKKSRADFLARKSKLFKSWDFQICTRIDFETFGSSRKGFLKGSQLFFFSPFYWDKKKQIIWEQSELAKTRREAPFTSKDWILMRMKQERKKKSVFMSCFSAMFFSSFAHFCIHPIRHFGLNFCALK